MSNTTEKVTKTNRHYGEGSIYQRKDGRWVAKYRDEAMAKPQYLYGSTEAEVRRKLRDWKKQTARGLTACKKVFFRDYADNSDIFHLRFPLWCHFRVSEFLLQDRTSRFLSRP